MRYPLVKWVDAPTLTANELFDFNSDTGSALTWPLHDGWSVGVPSFDGDPDSVGVEYGYRTLKFTLAVSGAKEAALAKQSALAKEVFRRRSWVMFQINAFTKPVWFRTYRSEPGDLSFDLFRNGDGVDEWHIGVTMSADAFAYGARVTIPQFIIGNNTTATNPMRYTLPTIQGDAPTALRVKVAPQAGDAGTASTWLQAVISGDRSNPMLVVDIGSASDGWTGASGDVTGPITPASGNIDSGVFLSNSLRITAGAATFRERIAGPLPNTLIGRYKVLLRIGSESDAEFDFAFGQKVNGVVYYGNTVRARTVDDYSGPPFWVDLGDFTFPFGLNIPAGVTGTLPVPQVSLKVGCTSTRATQPQVKLDAFAFIPVDGPGLTQVTTLASTFKQYGVDQTRAGNWDGDTESFWSTLGATFVDGGPEMVGSYVKADPMAAYNVFVLMPTLLGEALSNTAITSINGTHAVDISYHPRYLWIGDGS